MIKQPGIQIAGADSQAVCPAISSNEETGSRGAASPIKNTGRGDEKNGRQDRNGF